MPRDGTGLSSVDGFRCERLMNSTSGAAVCGIVGSKDVMVFLSAALQISYNTYQTSRRCRVLSKVDRRSMPIANAYQRRGTLWSRRRV
ncbi:hypothetical protein Ahu01nite_085820 [Winogradskya humida]|uniref:Uncharacterized protein n=1 Tax=Winogradskya humida TaxID=113566 RepID=A0ABQ4A3Q5_9ACTN|nr:hypothetical protein Ahu01nite_085820 [Actinoplanes humidus]